LAKLFLKGIVMVSPAPPVGNNVWRIWKQVDDGPWQLVYEGSRDAARQRWEELTAEEDDKTSKSSRSLTLLPAWRGHPADILRRAQKRRGTR
jgi:hypothetical protein